MDQYGVNISNNFNNLFEAPQLNSLSLRISYYLDYNRMKTWFGPKNQLQGVDFNKRDRKWGNLLF